MDEWTTFKCRGCYFYSRDIYLDLAGSRLVRGILGLHMGLDLSKIPVHYADYEVEIAYGRDYQHSITIQVPEILDEWIQKSATRSKSAGSAAICPVADS